MDPVTHAAFAVIVAEALPPHQGELFAVIAAAGGSWAPDIDVLIRPYRDINFLKWHHGPTHSGLGGALLAAIWALFVWFLPANPLSYWHVWLYASIGMLSHLFLDIIIHNNGLQLFWPLNRWPSLALFLGLNPYTSSARCGKRSLLICMFCQANSLLRNRIMYLVLATALSMAVLSPWRHWVARIGFVATLLYMFFVALMKFLAWRKAKNRYKDQGLRLFPAGFSPFRWLIVTGDFSRTAAILEGDVQFADIHVMGDGISSERRLNLTSSSLAVSSRDLPKVKTFLRNAALSGATEEKLESGDMLIKWRDLSYAFVPHVDLHVLRLVFSPDGELKDEEYRERW
ncbi:metal-dependent hydrolase [Acidobacteriota bacterium]